MLYETLVELYDFLEKNPSRLVKIDKISEFLRKTKIDELPMVTLMLQGKVFPSYSDNDIGIAGKMMVRIISKATGFSEREIMKIHNKKGDFGLTSEDVKNRKRQSTLGNRKLTVKNVFSNLRKLASTEGRGSQSVKMNLVRELITHSTPRESKYIVRTVLLELRIGVAAGVIRDSIARAFLPHENPEEMKKSVKAAEWAWFLRSDYSEIARIAKEKGLPGLKKIKPKLGLPVRPLLGEKSPGLKDALDSFEKCAVEFKYDGMRTQIHVKGDRVWLFTRRLEDVTDAFPDIVEMVKECVKSDELIIEGEALGIDSKTGSPLPFQNLSQRIHRKYDIERMVKKIPVQVNLFDAIMVNGKTLFHTEFLKRRKILEGIIREKPGRFTLAEQLITKDLKKAERFYSRALRAKQEGVMVKNLEAFYHPGRRVAGGMLKVKPLMETLDLVITGAHWGTGKRAKWLGSFILSCRKGEEFLECGMMGTGIKEKSAEKDDVTFERLTRILRPHVSSEKGNKVIIKPSLVVEVAYEEIQKSPNYSSGYALRFPRLVRLRSDEKKPEQADTLERIEHLYGIQKGKRP